MIDVKKNTEIIDILRQYGFKDVLLEDGDYRIMDKEYFEPKLFGFAAFKKAVGFKVWEYSLGASDCGKFCIQYQAQLHDKYRDKFVRGSSGGGDIGSSTSMNIEEHYPALLVGFVKYLRRDGKWHIVNSTIIKNGDNYMPVFFERTSNGFNWVYMSEDEKKTIVYFHAY